MKRVLNKRLILMYLMVIGMYFAFRLPLLTIQNEYFDYDEGTYLLIARLINHGVYPYRDIFAVHPPLYYYALAGWLRLFGDNYISGRVFSLTLGLLSVFLAYRIGKELKNEILGLSFSFLIALDPLAIKINTLVLHGSLIEFFTLASLFMLIKYLNTRKFKFAIGSIFIASIGSAAKFTILPYLVAIYIFLILYYSPKLREYLHSTTTKILSERQGYIITVTYLLWIVLIVVAVVLYPSSTSRRIFIVPGIHSISRIEQIYTAIVFIFFWLTVTIFVFRLRYLEKLKDFFRSIPAILKPAGILALTVVLAKATIEIPLGLLVSNQYIWQTYFGQNHRFFPFIGIFWMMHNVLSKLQSSYPESIVYLVPMFLLSAIFLLYKARNEHLKSSHALNSLFLLNIAAYLIVMPIIPDIRLIYPMVLVGYITLLYPLSESMKTHKKGIGAIVLIIVLLSLINIGIDVHYKSGCLSIPSAKHTYELREDLGAFIHQHSLNGTYLSINPMNAYYLDLQVIPYMIDTFGLGYLMDKSLVNLTKTYKPNYIIFSTWMFSVMKRSTVLFEVYEPLFRYTLQNGTLLFAESTNNGEVIGLFNLEKTNTSFKIFTSSGKIMVILNTAEIVNITPYHEGTPPEDIKINYSSKGRYTITAKIGDSIIHGWIQLGTNDLMISLPQTSLQMDFKGVVVKEGKPFLSGSTQYVTIYTPNSCFNVYGNITAQNSRISIENTIRISRCGYH